MEVCPKCGADNVDEARYCEACGIDLEEAESLDAAQTTAVEGVLDSAEGAPGSLREQIPFLTGAVEQARARLDDWRQRGERSRQDKERQEEAARQEREQGSSALRGSVLGNFWSLLVGILALVAFVYLLIRLPRNQMSPAMVWMLLEEVNQTMRDQFGLPPEG